MKPRTHLFVAAEMAFGEAVLGLRIAHELHARGDRIVVLAGEALSVLTKDTPFRMLAVPQGALQHGVSKLIVKAVADVRADTVILLDATLVLFQHHDTGATVLQRLGEFDADAAVAANDDMALDLVDLSLHAPAAQ